jgi:transcriptional regulator with XRE-family HTH domain
MGSTIRGLRRRHGLTLVQLAERAELSHSFLSQVERGLAQPSMRSLHRIAQVLGTSQDKLIAGAVTDDETPPIAVLRAGEGVKIPLGGAATPTGSARQLLTEPGSFYPTEFVGVGRDFGEFFQHEGNEFVYIAEGNIEVELGDATYLLTPGDSFRYPGRVPHRWRATDGANTRVLMVHTGVHAHPMLS